MRKLSGRLIHNHLLPMPVRSTSPDDGVLNTDVGEGMAFHAMQWFISLLAGSAFAAHSPCAASDC